VGEGHQKLALARCRLAVESCEQLGRVGVLYGAKQWKWMAIVLDGSVEEEWKQDRTRESHRGWNA